MDLMKIILIGIGGAIGSIARYLASTQLQTALNSIFPFGTLFVNVTGCFLVSLVFVLLVDRFYAYSSEFRSLLIIGFMGGYTTFSSFSFETINLFEQGEILSAFLNVIITVSLCLMATYLGILIGRWV